MPMISGGSNSGGSVYGTSAIVTGSVKARYVEQWEVLGIKTGSLSGRAVDSWDVLGIKTGPITARTVDSWENFVQPPTPPQGTSMYNVLMADNPVGYYRMDMPGVPTTEADIAGNNTGHYTGAYTFGQPGATGGGDGSVSFSGGQMYTSNSYSNPTTFTLAGMFKTTTSGGIITFGGQQTGTNSSYDRKVYVGSDGKLAFGIYTGSTAMVYSQNAVTDGKWHFFVATLGSDGMKLYLDGVEQGSNGANNPQNYNGFWRIGYVDAGWPDMGNTTFSGDLDEIAIWMGTELSQADVTELQNAISGTDYKTTVLGLSPTSYWRMDAEAPSSYGLELDRSGHGLHGTYGGTFTPEQPSLMLYKDTDTATLFNSGYLNLPFDFTAAIGFTFIFWVNEKSNPGSATYIADSNLSADGSNKGVELWNDGGNWACAVGNGTTTASSTNMGSIPDNSVDNHMIVLGWDGTNVYFLVDNQQLWSAPLSGGELGSPHNMAIGYNPVTSANPIDAVLDEFAIYDHWLGTDRIKAIYEASLGEWNADNNYGQLLGSASGGNNAVGMNGQRPDYIEVIYV